MEEKIILGIKDKNNNYYLCYREAVVVIDESGVKAKPLVKGEEIKVGGITIFPTEEAGPLYTPVNGEKYVFLNVLTDIECDYETEERTCDERGNITTRTLDEVGTVVFLDECTNPMNSALLMYLEALDIAYAESVVYSWGSFGFNSMDEFEAYKTIFMTMLQDEKYEHANFIEFELSKLNMDYLKEILELEKIDIVADGNLFNRTEYPSMNIAEVTEIVDALPREMFFKFHQKSHMKYLELSQRKMIDADFTKNHMMNMERFSWAGIVEFVIESIGADRVLEIAMPEIIAFREKLINEYGEYLPGAEFGTAEDERDILSKILPTVTEASLPLLKILEYDYIEPYLEENVKPLVR